MRGGQGASHARGGTSETARVVLGFLLIMFAMFQQYQKESYSMLGKPWSILSIFLYDKA
jgi:hypothetical protein